MEECNYLGWLFLWSLGHINARLARRLRIGEEL
jgi:hypothetical protein